jgi:hypothetical protein
MENEVRAARERLTDQALAAAEALEATVSTLESDMEHAAIIRKLVERVEQLEKLLGESKQWVISGIADEPVDDQQRANGKALLIEILEALNPKVTT